MKYSVTFSDSTTETFWHIVVLCSAGWCFWNVVVLWDCFMADNSSVQAAAYCRISWIVRQRMTSWLVWRMNLSARLCLRYVTSEFIHHHITSHGEDGRRPQWPLYPKNNFIIWLCL